MSSSTIEMESLKLTFPLYSNKYCQSALYQTIFSWPKKNFILACEMLSDLSCYLQILIYNVIIYYFIIN